MGINLIAIILAIGLLGLIAYYYKNQQSKKPALRGISLQTEKDKSRERLKKNKEQDSALLRDNKKKPNISNKDLLKQSQKK